MKFPANIQSRYIIAGTLAIALLMFGSAFLELRQSRSELLQVLREHSLSLAEAIERSSANVVLSTDHLERELSSRLLNNSYYIARLDSLGLLSQRDLQRFASANNVYRINIFNARGEKVVGSHEPVPHAEELTSKQSPKEVLKPILSGAQTVLIIGLKEARFEEGQRYAVAVRRTRAGGGAIVLNLDAADLLEFRKRIGIGKLVKDLGDNSGIDYVVLQDRDGILAATSGVNEMSRVDQDSLVATAMASDSVFTRQIGFGEKQTFEVVKRLSIEGTTVGVLRIGLSLDELRSAEDRMNRRMLIMTIVLVALGTLVFTAIVVNQNYRLVSRQYAVMQSLTGNILANMRDAVVSVDGEGRITVFNSQAEALFSLPGSGVMGKRLEELQDPQAGCLMSIFEAGDQERTLECSGQAARIVSLSHSRTLKPDGNLESRTVVIKDLTQERRMELEIRRKDKLTAMGELASGVAHEVRNPLNAISMIAQRYEREFVPRSGVKEYRTLTHVLKKEAERVNGIVQQFLMFARPPKLKISQVPARQFVEHVSTLFEGQAQSKGVTFSSQCDVDAFIHIDSEQMTQALLNLLQNALEASKKGNTISLGVRSDGENVVLEVADDGIGIPHNALDRIFNLYFTTKSTGTGMGLAICQQIVTQHRGSIEAQSEPGKGTRFTIRIPRGNLS